MPANSVIDSPMPAELDIDDKAQVIHIDNPTQDEDAIKNSLNGTTILKPHLGLLATVRAYPKVTFLCFIAALSAISDGYQINLSGSIIALPGFINQFGFPTGANGAMVLNPNHVSLFGSESLVSPREGVGLTLAAVKVLFTGVGAALGTWPSDRFGRKPMILAIQIVLACGTILEMFSTTWAHWVGARTIEGFGNGLNISVTSVYIAELAPTDGRGALIAFYAVWVSLDFSHRLLSSTPSEDSSDPSHYTSSRPFRHPFGGVPSGQTGLSRGLRASCGSCFRRHLGTTVRRGGRQTPSGYSLGCTGRLPATMWMPSTSCSSERCTTGLKPTKNAKRDLTQSFLSSPTW
jgi:hypothetical protein